MLNDHLGIKDRLEWRDFKDHKDVGINFGHSIKLVIRVKMGIVLRQLNLV